MNVKQIAEDYSNKVWNDKDLSAVDRYIDHKVVIHSLLGQFYGFDEMKKVVQSWLTGFPDLHVENERIISEGDIVSIQWKATGTHQGHFKGRAPTGKTVKYHGVTVYRIQNDKVIEYWAYLDMNHLLSQLD